jgi:hypothetical protein
MDRRISPTTVIRPTRRWRETARPKAGRTLIAMMGTAPQAEGYHRVLPEMFDGPHGTMMRLGATALIAMVLILTVLGGLTMFSQLSRIVDR